MDKYLVTGGAGFIGSHIAQTLLQKGHKVTILDNLRSGNIKNLETFRGEFVFGNILDKDLVNRLAKGVAGIFHLAAMVSVPESLQNIDDCSLINCKGTLNVLEAAKLNPGCKVILSSTAAIYGNNPKIPKKECMLPEPMTPYAITKLDGEYYLNMFKYHWNIPSASLRYFNVFGPRQNPNSAYAAAIPLFIQKALLGEPLIIYGNGKQTRDFIYVKDVVQANLFAMDHCEGILNVALGISLSILDLAEKIIAITNSNSRIEFHPVRPGDIQHSLADTERITHLGFKPSFNFEKGLIETIDCFDNLLAADGKSSMC
jgi:UDP-glucose 4-epimerase